MRRSDRVRLAAAGLRRVDSEVDPLASGVHPGVHPCAEPKSLHQRGYSAQVDSLDSGWLPKKPGLTLANYRAAPSRIGRSPGRNRDFSGLAAAGESWRSNLDGGWREKLLSITSCALPSFRPPAPLASTTEGIPNSPGWCKPCRCLTRRCLTTSEGLDA